MVLFQCETTVIGNGPISGDFVLIEKHIHEMVGVLFSFIVDVKVVNYKQESDGNTFVLEYTRGVLGLMIA